MLISYSVFATLFCTSIKDTLDMDVFLNKNVECMWNVCIQKCNPVFIEHCHM
jgi:hypothetical protein